MTIYELNIISTTGLPYYGELINEIPEGVKVYLSFFDFSKQWTDEIEEEEEIDPDSKFGLTAGLISALFEFSRAIDKKIYMLEFQSKSEKVIIDENELKGEPSETLITISADTYLLHDSIREKIEIIYETIIQPKIPLVTADELLTPEKDKIREILDDTKARNNIKKNYEEIMATSQEFLIEMQNNGLQDICIASFDLSILEKFGDTYTQDNIENILRKINEIPEIPVFEYKQRMINYDNNEVWVYIINSGTGITEESLGQTIFEPYFYILFCKSESYLGEFIEKLLKEFNDILKE